jgi:hypothetical protein
MAVELDVLVLVQDGCHFCRDAQALLGSLAGEYPLRIHTLDIGTPEGETIAIQSGLLFPPGILLQGRPLCYGRPSEGKLRRAFEKILSGDPRFGQQEEGGPKHSTRAQRT